MSKAAIAALILLTSSAAAQAPAGKVAFSCTGTGTHPEGQAHPWAVSMRIVIDFTAGTVQLGNSFTEEITGINDTHVEFGRSHDLARPVVVSALGFIDRVTGDAQVETTLYVYSEPSTAGHLKLQCQPV